jgi:hypothetical protein
LPVWLYKFKYVNMFKLFIQYHIIISYHIIFTYQKTATSITSHQTYHHTTSHHNTSHHWLIKNLQNAMHHKNATSNPNLLNCGCKKKLCFQVHPIVNASIYATCLTEPPLQQHFFNLVANVRSEIPMVLMAPAILWMCHSQDLKAKY